MPTSELATIPFIAHKMPEVLMVSDMTTILRTRKLVKRFKREEATTEALPEPSKLQKGKPLNLRFGAAAGI